MSEEAAKDLEKTKTVMLYFVGHYKLFLLNNCFIITSLIPQLLLEMFSLYLNIKALEQLSTFF